MSTSIIGIIFEISLNNQRKALALKSHRLVRFLLRKIC